MLILSNVAKLYDGTSADADAVHEAVDLLIAEGRVHALEPHRDDRPTTGDDVVVDASELTVVPGMVDCHGHVTVLGLRREEMDAMLTPAALLYVEKILFTTLVDGGVTTMRDVGGATSLMKRLVDDGTMIGPRLKVSICMLSSTGGHADFRGPDRCHAEVSRLWPDGPGRPSSIVDGPWEARTRVREIAACGGDLIKLCTSPGVASPADHLENRDLHPEEIAAICEEATARGLRVAAHAHSRSGIRLAIENGVHDIQHISFLDEECVALAHERGCTMTPTSWVMEALLEADGLDPFVVDKARRAADAHRNAVQLAAAGEIPILAGTDPVLPGMHGRNFMEIVHLVRDGLPELRAWYGATGLAAREIGQDDAGELAPGKRADLLVCRGDVVSEPERLDRGALVEVVKDGLGHRGGLEGVPQRRFESTVLDVLPGRA